MASTPPIQPDIIAETSPSSPVPTTMTPSPSTSTISKKSGSKRDSSRSDEFLPIDTDSSGANKKEIKSEKSFGEKPKKKSSWYSVLYPTYKTRSEGFKRLFKELPLEERLVVDYSCALQRDILVHGRLYVSPGYLCFYANIFGWETSVTVPWRQVTGLTKEKTALVIPNAILVTTNSERFFFTSFGARDKTFLMLFRIWQNALLDKSLTNQELWQLVHSCYGDELGLTSDDEDYVSSTGMDEDSVANLSCSLVMATPINLLDPNAVVQPSINSNLLAAPSTADSGSVQTDLSDTTESDAEKNTTIAVCPSPHDGREMLDAVFPIPVDQLFSLLFTTSTFFVALHTNRKTYDIQATSWTPDKSTGIKRRQVTMTISINNSVGPKTAQVTEDQVMSPVSSPGKIYVIDVEANQAGIPYADSFYIINHFCLVKISDTECRLTVNSHLKYRKSVWGLVKTFIEKNSWSGLEDFYKALSKALSAEAEALLAGEATSAAVKRKNRIARHRRVRAGHVVITSDTPICTTTVASSGEGSPTVRAALVSQFVGSDRPMNAGEAPTCCSWIIFATLLALLLLNAVLYHKLWGLEEWGREVALNKIELPFENDKPQSHEDWLRLLQKQEVLHRREMDHWQRFLDAAINLLKQAEETLKQLHSSIKGPSVSTVWADESTSNGNSSPPSDEL
ncbi:protein Aster-B-like isoform X2 [Neocloeon triangulifer]|uniref:protein Aster-B-like isoform X2 n=1 Tax=Neocloeon triangulifer TaxID=2078957 RepID=UPI00286F225D|nr:protein Aster-B-like isoform X2 [Neocloeon triangulifer]